MTARHFKAPFEIKMPLGDMGAFLNLPNVEHRNIGCLSSPFKLMLQPFYAEVLLAPCPLPVLWFFFLTVMMA